MSSNKAQLKVIHWIHRTSGKTAPDIELVDREKRDEYIPLWMLPIQDLTPITKRTIALVEVHDVDNGD